MTTCNKVTRFCDQVRFETGNFLDILAKANGADGQELEPLFDEYISKFEELRASYFATQTMNSLSPEPQTDPTKSLITSVQHELKLSEGATEITVKRPTRHISWHEYFMSVAQLAARRSKDPATQVGACIVNEQNKIVATGYNGMPNGIDDNRVPWTKEGSYLDTKYAYVVHAELNAILNCVLTDQTGCRVYVSLFPCNECAKAIIQSGIRHVIYLSDKHKDRDSTKAAKIMFEMAGIVFEQYSSLVAM